MKKYLIDVNLPYYFELWNKEEYIHQMDLGNKWQDEEIWNYARENNLTIISKDSDFSNMIMMKQPPPKVIHIKTGNMKIKEFDTLISGVWEEVIKLIDDCKLVNVYKERILGIR